VGVLALAVVVAIGVVGYGSLLAGDGPAADVEEVVLPRLAGRPLAQAQQEVERLGLLVDLRYEPNELVPPDVVVEHEPIAGARVEVGSQVVLVVSDGPAGLVVPDLAGVSAPEAVRTLSVLGLVGVPEEVFDERVPQNEVVGTVPASGSRAAPGSQVRVQVSRGPEPRVVPDVVGRPSAEAFAAIGRADLQVGAVTRRYQRDAEPGTVLSTRPAADASVPRDTPIAVVVAASEPVARVPDLVGLTRASAQQLAASLDVPLTVRTEELPPGDPRAGLVVRQSPVANSPADGAVTVVVGVVPSPTTTTTTAPGPATSTTTTAP
jgi:serine/threonine-protein kinase